MNRRLALALIVVSLSCAREAEPEPIPAAAAPALAPAPAAFASAPESASAPSRLEPVTAEELPPEPAEAEPDCTHQTLHAACMEFEGVDFDEDCGEIESGVMPDGSTRYHLTVRMWSETRQAELLVLESGGCFTLIGDLGWNTLSTHVNSTTMKAIDLDADGTDEVEFRIVELDTDPDTLRQRTIRTARYCRAIQGTWTCTEPLSRRPSATDWPE